MLLAFSATATPIQIRSLIFFPLFILGNNIMTTLNSLGLTQGIFTVGSTGKVAVDYLFDGGGNKREIAISALQLGFWAGQILRENSPVPGPVFIGQDSRNSSDMLAMAIAAGLTSAGLEVWQLGLCPTPCVAHLAGVMDAIGGIMISASHNPPEDNGIKFFSAEGLKLGKTQTQRIEAGLRGQIASSIANSSPYGKAFHDPNMVNYYGQFLLNGLPKE
jgi:phosphomannomutase